MFPALFLSLTFPLNFLFGNLQISRINPLNYPTINLLPKVTPTLFPTPTFFPSPTIILKITSTPTPMPTSTPTPNPSASNSSITDFIMNGINNYRRSLGLSPTQPDPYTCNFAATRAQEISAGFNHDGFTNRLNNHILPYPSYSLVTENIAMASDYRSVANMWINSPTHAANIQKDTTFACVKNFGKYYVYESWKP